MEIANMIMFQPMIPSIVIIIIGIVIFVLMIYCLINKKLRKTHTFRRLSIILATLLVLLRPALPNGSESSQENNINIFFAVDSSSSMSVKDIGGSRRFEIAKKDIVNIAKSIPGSQYSIILLDSAAHTIMPLSGNLDLLETSTEMIMPINSSYGGGTNIGNLLEVAEKHISSYSKKYPNKTNVLFVLSDGEDTTGTIAHISVSFKNIISSGAVFGYGSTNGDIMEDYSYDKKGWTSCVQYYGNNAKVKTKSGPRSNETRCAISAINEESLKRIASSLNVGYYHRENDETPTDIINDIKSNVVFRAGSTVESSMDIYWIFAIIAISLLLWEFADSFYKILLERSRYGRA